MVDITTPFPRWLLRFFSWNQMLIHSSPTDGRRKKSDWRNFYNCFLAWALDLLWVLGRVCNFANIIEWFEEQFPGNSAIAWNLGPEKHVSCYVRVGAELTECKLFTLCWSPAFADALCIISVFHLENLHCLGFLFSFQYGYCVLSGLNCISLDYSEHTLTGDYKIWKKTTTTTKRVHKQPIP